MSFFPRPNRSIRASVGTLLDVWTLHGRQEESALRGSARLAPGRTVAHLAQHCAGSAAQIPGTKRSTQDPVAEVLTLSENSNASDAERRNNRLFSIWTPSKGPVSLWFEWQVQDACWVSTPLSGHIFHAKGQAEPVQVTRLTRS